MKAIIFWLGLAVGLLNPLSAPYVQSLVMQGWDLGIIYGGVWVTVVFGVVCVFYGGMLWSAMQARDDKQQSDNIKKSKKSSRKLDGMVYEA
jgi:threonine/homoserine/homoserine lactone efflux protein